MTESLPCDLARCSGRGTGRETERGVGDQHLRQRAVDQVRHERGAHAQVAGAGDVVVAVEGSPSTRIRSG